ncbi:MAG: hypothetical protein KC592_06745 [Nitrospira sp.]|nr:hypothetical protein [Nitrospira sp.]HBP86661.1 hypothetical protein [Nitrospiraceae bacterium]HNP29194.1 hypothetical protein [Nitrospirales bacterium]
MGIAWIDDRTTVVSWMTAPDTVTQQSHLAVRTFSVNGSLGPVQHLMDISAGRDTGMPQLIVDDKEFLLAWTGAAPDHGIHTVRVRPGLLAV